MTESTRADIIPIHTSEITLWSCTLHAGGGLAHEKEKTGFHGIRNKGKSGHAFINQNQSNLL
ncbi:hypothetical protein EXN66_Car008405 [Channa argus]|uniref:Uncharacterized protein n=1 Tax=Channa argus TaxID=215402 RepID=A0A6G1PR76_CHAAH|nr:hypothetical protein EXN66_Car008405 [Channa argus]